MTGKLRQKVVLGLIGLVLVLIISVAALWRSRNPGVSAGVNPPTPPPSPTTKPHAATVPSPPGLDEPYLALIRRAYPRFAATQPFGIPVDLPQAGHLIFSEPVYLCTSGRQEMWITSPSAPPMAEVLEQAVDSTVDVHIVPERVAFVHWMPANDSAWPPYVVCQKGTGDYDVVSSANGRRPLPHRVAYFWKYGASWNEKVVVPTDNGISVFHFGRKMTESHYEFSHPPAASQPAQYARPQFLFDAQGLLAWQPWESGKIGGRGAVRYVEPASDELATSPAEPKWVELTPEDGWPAKMLHLVPLLDGTVLMLTVDEQDAVAVQFNTLEHANVQPEVIVQLVNQLSDPDSAVRDAASDKLSQYGSGIWPILEKMLNDQGPEAQARMKQLLKQKVTPTLNGMELLGTKQLSLAARLADGGTVFYAPAGVSIPNRNDPDAQPDTRIPAWISIRPGRAIELLPDSFTSTLTPGQSTLYANGDDWIVTSDRRGPRRFFGNGFVALLRKTEHDFSDFVGIDRRGRWIFAKPATSQWMRQATTESSYVPGQTLIIDPTLPDPVPRLPVWVLNISDEVGWTKAGWPYTKKTSAYALNEDGWQLVAEQDQLFKDAKDAPPPFELPSSTSPTTLPDTQPTTTATTQETPILIDHDGSRYFGGLEDLRVVPRRGPPMTFTLPSLAIGKGPVWLIRTSDHYLYLFNQPGRVVRLRPTPGHAEPFEVEKIFTHHVPTVDQPTRIWLDPAGRIIMAWENQLAIFFPAGFIPKPIADLMVPGDQDEED